MADPSPRPDHPTPSSISAVTVTQTATIYTLSSAGSSRLSSTSTKPRNNAAIIAPVVVVSFLLLFAVLYFVLRQRRHKQNAERSLHRPQPSGSEANPLLVTPLVWSQPTPHIVRDLESAAVHSRGPSSSDGTPLMQSVRESELSGSDTYTSSPRRMREPPSLDPMPSGPPQRTMIGETVLSPMSTYSQSSASTRVEQEINGEALSSARWTLPPIPQTEPLANVAEMLRAREGPGPSASGSLDSSHSHTTEPYLEPQTSVPGPSLRNPFSRNLSRSASRGNSARPRTVLPHPPMEPLIEDGSGSPGTQNAARGGTERWSSVADPGSSRPRALSNNSHTQPLHIQPFSYQPSATPPSHSPTTPASSGGLFGFGLLTSAFRKSVSASSLASDTTNLHHAYPSHIALPTANDTNASLQHFASADSLGATSATGSSGSGGGTFYSMSEFGDVRDMNVYGSTGQGTGNTRDRSNMPQAMQSQRSRQSRAPSSRNSLSTYPSIPSLPSLSMRSSATSRRPLPVRPEGLGSTPYDILPVPCPPVLTLHRYFPFTAARFRIASNSTAETAVFQ